MAAPPTRARADYDYLIKLLLIGDSGYLLSNIFMNLMNMLCKISYFVAYSLVHWSYTRSTCCMGLRSVTASNSDCPVDLFSELLNLGKIEILGTDFTPSLDLNRLLIYSKFGSKFEFLFCYMPLQVWVRVAFFCVSQMGLSPLVLLPPLGACSSKLHIDFKIRTIELDGKRIKLQIWDTAGQERFRTITTAYYRGAMGILLVYDVTDESSFNSNCLILFHFYHSNDSYEASFLLCSDIKNWIRNIEQHASDNVNKILVGNKADMDESKRAVPTSKGQALADEYGIKFFETSAKTNLNVEQVFFSIARDIKQRLAETDSRSEPQTIRISKPDQTAGASQTSQNSACCGS
ncbi:hypothetical protein HHK36_010940 [Tetracentron sinense]|uniref:Uncharacterized protein n=1 Tax=Tetracentron sinense TaxID=13715 RepID=A0A834Z781_TETSI|nr:hypothetical protein HHK36_010940 [Tetracentron sinense]